MFGAFWGQSAGTEGSSYSTTPTCTTTTTTPNPPTGINGMSATASPVTNSTKGVATRAYGEEGAKAEGPLVLPLLQLRNRRRGNSSNASTAQTTSPKRSSSLTSLFSAARRPRGSVFIPSEDAAGHVRSIHSTTGPSPLFQSILTHDGEELDEATDEPNFDFEEYDELVTSDPQDEEALYHQAQVLLFSGQNDPLAFHLFSTYLSSYITLSEAESKVPGLPAHYASASAILAFCHEFGIGTSPNCSKAYTYYTQAAAHHEGLALIRLLFFKRYGRDGIAIDTEGAKTLLEQVASATANGVDLLAWCRQLIAHPPQSMQGDVRTSGMVSTHAYASALYVLGACYQDGIGIPANTVEAVSYYRKAAFLRHPRALGILGYCYANSIGGLTKHPSRAFASYLDAAKGGDSVSMFNLAQCYENGGISGVPVQFKQALFWYNESAKMGNCYAQNRLGYIYEEGLGGVRVDKQLAVHWYTQSAQLGYAVAQCNLGFCHQNGIALPRDEEAAMHWYGQAAAQGLARAQHNLGHLLQFGPEPLRDLTRAVTCYRQSADTTGSPFSLHSLGFCYQHGVGVDVDVFRAFEFYRRAALANHPPAQLSLGSCYRHGIGCDVNPDQALYWITSAAQKGNDLAQNTLGHFYEDGICTEVDYGLARRWYAESAEQGNVWALTNLAGMYGEGKGVAIDIPHAVALLRRAVQGSQPPHVQACLLLAGYLLHGVPQTEGLLSVEPEPREACRLYRLAAEQGSVSAMTAYANCLESMDDILPEATDDMQTTQDALSLAIYWYERAALAGDWVAKERLVALLGGTFSDMDDDVHPDIARCA